MIRKNKMNENTWFQKGQSLKTHPLRCPAYSSLLWKEGRQSSLKGEVIGRFTTSKNEERWLSLLRPVLVGVEGSVLVLKVTDFAGVRANSLAKDGNERKKSVQTM